MKKSPHEKQSVILLPIYFWASLKVVHEIDYLMKLLSGSDVRVLLSWAMSHWQIVSVVFGAVIVSVIRRWRGSSVSGPSES